MRGGIGGEEGVGDGGGAGKMRGGDQLVRGDEDEKQESGSKFTVWPACSHGGLRGQRPHGHDSL